MQSAAFNREAQDEAAEEEGDDIRRVGRGDAGHGLHAGEREERERHERGGAERQRLGNPPDGHEHGTPGARPSAVTHARCRAVRECRLRREHDIGEHAEQRSKHQDQRAKAVLSPGRRHGHS
jgi:hypothetical protein